MYVHPSLIRPCVLFGWKEEEGWDERQKDAAIALRPRWMNQVAPRSYSLVLANYQHSKDLSTPNPAYTHCFLCHLMETWELKNWYFKSDLKRTSLIMSNGGTAKYRTLTNISTCFGFSGIKSRDCALCPAEKFLENFELLRHRRLNLSLGGFTLR